MRGWVGLARAAAVEPDGSVKADGLGVGRLIRTMPGRPHNFAPIVMISAINPGEFGEHDYQLTLHDADANELAVIGAGRFTLGAAGRGRYGTAHPTNAGLPDGVFTLALRVDGVLLADYEFQVVERLAP